MPLTVNLTIQDSGARCANLAGAAVYLWQCDRDGNYSLYSQGVTNQNYLRGVQVSDDGGLVRFQSIFPACYSGRWPHIHFEVYSSLDDVKAGRRPMVTSQLALPKDACDEVFPSPGYEQSVRGLSRVSLERDNVFADGSGRQLAVVEGSLAAGYTAALSIQV